MVAKTLKDAASLSRQDAIDIVEGENTLHLGYAQDHLVEDWDRATY